MLSNAPKIGTAIPKRRYSIGAFSAVILNDIISEDGRVYRFIFAVVPEGENDPTLYITLEKDTPNAQGDDYSMRVLAEGQEKIFPATEELDDIETFTQAALEATKHLFGLTDEEPYQIQ